MKTPICVLHYNDILHITVGSAIQQVDILFACVRHLGSVSVSVVTKPYCLMNSFCIYFPSLTLCLLYKSRETYVKEFERRRAYPKRHQYTI